jgi:hypothetical protein
MTPAQQLCYEQHREQWMALVEGHTCPICHMIWTPSERRLANIETRIDKIEKQLNEVLIVTNRY